VSETVYRCPLCLSDAARVSDELIWRRNDDGSITVETLMGRALRVEALLEDHMARVHDLTPEEAVEALSVGQV
jgi:hypothetical protein